MRNKKESLFRRITNSVYDMDEGTKKGIGIVFLFLIGGLSFLSLFGLAGRLGVSINNGLANVFGISRIIFPTTILSITYLKIYPDKYDVKKSNYVGLFFLFVAIPGLSQLIMETYSSYILEKVLLIQNGGGYVGYLMNEYPRRLMGSIATSLILLAILIIGILLTFNTSLWKLKEHVSILMLPMRKIKEALRRKKWAKYEEEQQGSDLIKKESREFIQDDEIKEEEAKEEPEINKPAEEIAMEQEIKVEPKRVYKRIDLPLGLLDDQLSKPTSGDIKANGELIRRTLESFGISVEMGEVNVGPTVTQFTLKPAEGIKLSQITTLHNDLALALAAHPIRIEAPIPGRPLVGIEVPNQKIAVVSLKEILQSTEFVRRKSNLMLALGKDVSGKPWMADLARMPHLLIAGSTGSGKTICINAIIMSLLYQNTPETLKFVLVDPKRVELPIYNGINYLVTPVITEVKKTVNALKWCIIEMERRFEVLANAHKRDIESFNNETEEKLPYIVVIIDELADLMSSAGSEVEGSIIRLAQMARAVGIHLILATQRPSVNVITGLIKANVPARIAFSVASLMDSRTILDSAGAEKLLGRGDMLFLSAEISKPKRLQGAYLGDKEIKRVVNYIKDNTDEAPVYNDEVVENKFKGNGSGGMDGDEESDELLEEAKQIIISANRASTSLLQRRLKIGYSRAARIIDLLEEQGVVGPAEGSKPREVIKNE